MSNDRRGLVSRIVLILASAAGRAELTVDERALVERNLTRYRREELLTNAEAQLRAGQYRAARSTLLDVALGPSFAPSARLKAAAAFLLPRGAAFQIRRQVGKTRTSRLSRQLGLDPPAGREGARDVGRQSDRA